MTRSAASTQAVAAQREAQAAASALPEPGSMKYHVFEDNGGGYTIVAASGETLVQSAGFTSYKDAEQAARIVYAGAGAAAFEPPAGDTPPVDLAARRDARRSPDELDAERWLDEGGSFSSEAVGRWPAPR